MSEESKEFKVAENIVEFNDDTILKALQEQEKIKKKE